MPSTAETLETALAHHKAGEMDEAAALYAEVLAVEPEHAEVHHLLGVMAYQRGLYARAEAQFRRAIAADGDVGKYHGNLGAALTAQGRWAEALPALERAVALEPETSETQNSLGAAYAQLGRTEEAIAAYRAAIALAPGYAQPQANLAVLLLQTGRAEEARAGAEEAVRLDPDDADARNALALVHRQAGRLEDCRAELERALERRPDDPGLTRNLGMALLDLARPAAAEEVFRRLAELAPEDGGGAINLARALSAQGRAEEAVAHLRRAVDLHPENPVHHSMLLEGLQASPAATAAALLDEHRAWDARHAAALTRAAPPPGNDRSPERRLRVGYIVPRPADEPRAPALAAALAAHDREAVEVFGYAAAGSAAAEAAFGAACDHWRGLGRGGDEEAAAAVRGDGIDVLVDLLGHGPRTRLGLFARRAAPVQVSWSGQPAGTGLAAMDALIGDAVVTPADGAAVSIETVLRLPGSRSVFLPPAESPASDSLGGDGPVVFGSLAPAATLTPPVIETWARLAAEVPDARLLLADPAFGEDETAARLGAAFAAAGLPPERLDLAAAPDLELYRRIDVALDPFPLSAEQAMLEALWMGVAVITLMGERPASRLGAGILTAVGLEHLITESTIEYDALARSLAGETARLSALRSGIRDRLRASPICDPGATARALEDAYREAWRRWCANGS